MIALVLGFTETGSKAPLVVLYAGDDASAAKELANSPPPGIARAGLVLRPQLTSVRYFPEQAGVEYVADETVSMKLKLDVDSDEAQEWVKEIREQMDAAKMQFEKGLADAEARVSEVEKLLAAEQDKVKAFEEAEAKRLEAAAEANELPGETVAEEKPKTDLLEGEGRGAGPQGRRNK